MAGQQFPVDGASVTLLVHRDTLVLADLPGKLVGAHVHCDHVVGAVLQQAVGEATGRRAHVEATQPGDVEVEVVEGAFQLEPTAADIGMVRDLEANVRIGLHPGSGLVDYLVIDQYLACEDQATAAVARGDQAAFHQQLVDACASGHGASPTLVVAVDCEGRKQRQGVAVLTQRHDVEERAARPAAVTSGGSAGRALIAASGELATSRGAALELLDEVSTTRDARGRLEGAKSFTPPGKLPLAAIRKELRLRLMALTSLLRDIEVIAARARVPLANADLDQPLKRLAGAFADGRSRRAFSTIDEAINAIDRNASPKVVVDWVACQL